MSAASLPASDGSGNHNKLHHLPPVNCFALDSRCRCFDTCSVVDQVPLFRMELTVMLVSSVVIPLSALGLR
ncbi:hypothetical protein V6N11_034551 [Hibiscus sabdariffa]|uniref:Uncharacterized protein n=1 Tax=Hibiscus sabdariffa TaxID=183260 RepID=A0ABR2NH83_9ROSI